LLPVLVVLVLVLVLAKSGDDDLIR
jgi:hypothetical protein